MNSESLEDISIAEAHLGDVTLLLALSEELATDTAKDAVCAAAEDLVKRTLERLNNCIKL